MLLYETEIKQKLEKLPDNLKKEVLDFADYLSNKYKTSKKKYNKKSKIPNKATLQAMKDVEQGKNLNHYNSLDDFFKKMKK